MKEDVGNEMLVQRAIDGDRAAFAALISRHYDTMFRVAWKYCGNREDAEDIAQDVCVRLGKTLQSFHGQSKFSTWLYRVVLNATRDHHRKNASRAKKLDAWAVEPSRPDVKHLMSLKMMKQKACGALCANCRIGSAIVFFWCSERG